MPRFDRLEFDQPPQRPNQEATAELADRDEHYWLRLADENRRQGHHENALRYYSRALEMDKALVAGWLGQVQMLLALDESPEAELWARKALELFKNHGDLLAARAQALCRSGDLAQALALCDAALQREGSSAYRWVVRGELMLSQRESVDRHCFEKAAQINSDWLIALEIAAIYRLYKNAPLAQRWAGQAVQKAPESAYAWYMQALIELDLHLDARARASLGRCLALVPRHAEALQRLTELDQRGWSLGRFVRTLFRRS
jgi:tetratricopeptide (TPR) repeat protein